MFIRLPLRRLWTNGSGSACRRRSPAHCSVLDSHRHYWAIGSRPIEHCQASDDPLACRWRAGGVVPWPARAEGHPGLKTGISAVQRVVPAAKCRGAGEVEGSAPVALSWGPGPAPDVPSRTCTVCRPGRSAAACQRRKPSPQRYCGSVRAHAADTRRRRHRTVPSSYRNPASLEPWAPSARPHMRRAPTGQQRASVCVVQSSRRLGLDTLPAARALRHVGIVALRTGAVVVPVARLRLALPLDVDRRRGGSPGSR